MQIKENFLPEVASRKLSSAVDVQNHAQNHRKVRLEELFTPAKAISAHYDVVLVGIDKV